jgi:uncharacterized protein (DUF2267 family)
MTYANLISEVQRRAGLASADEAERALDVTACALGERLLAEEADAVADALPEPAAGHVRGARYERDFDVDELYDRVARREGVPHAFGMEHAQAACQVIGETLPEATRLRLQKHLGPAFAPLFEPRVFELPPARPVHGAPASEPGEGGTLASGRLGSRHPLSEAHPDTKR